MVITVWFYLLNIILQCVNDKVEKVSKCIFADTNVLFALMSDTQMSRSYENLEVDIYIGIALPYKHHFFESSSVRVDRV